MARKLEVEIVGDASSLHRALNQSTGSTNKFGGVLSKLKYAALGAGAAVAGGLVIGLEQSVKKAIEAQAVNARLGIAFRNAGLNAKLYGRQIEELESKSRKLGFTDEEVKTSLGSLITSTHSYVQASKQLGIAQDLARFKSVSLEAATKALTMAHAGSLRPIKQLGIDVPKVTTAVDALKAATKDHTTEAYKNALAVAKIQDKQTTFQNVLAATSKAVHGQAQAYSQTAAGAMEQFRAQLDHIEIAIGSRLLPVMTQAIQWITAHWPQISAAVTNAWHQIEPTLKALMALVVQVVQTIRAHWSTIGPIVRAAGQVIQGTLRELAGLIRIITALLRGDWAGAWQGMKQVASGAAQALAGLVRYELLIVKGAIDLVIGGIKALIGWLGHRFVMPGLNSVIGAFKTLYGWITSVIGAIKSIPHDISIHLHIPGSGAIGGILSKIPHATGGMVSPNTLSPYLVGERGPELFVPSGSGSIVPSGSSGGGPMQVNLQLDGKTLASVLIDPLRGEARLFQNRTGRPAFG